jgi:4-hydroxy-tetrahydrodipicolinate synthase
MIKETLTGTGVALVTPFNSNGSIDFDALGRLVDHVIQGGVEYLVVMGTTGETVTLSQEEKKEVLRFILDITNDTIPVVYGLGSNNTSALMKEAEQLETKGITALLSVSPYYNKPSQRGIIAHYKALASATSLPIILYNVPGRTGSNILASTTLTLSEVQGIIGIKEASGDLSQCMEIIAQAPSHFAVISGEDLLTPAIIGMGGIGAISVLANALPGTFSSMVRLALQRKNYESYLEAFELLPLNKLMYIEGNPTGIKALLEVKNLCGATVRLPLAEASQELKGQIQKAMQKKKLH